ncbi:MAG: LysR family transcriptional regulator [Oscillospiraceae bacterium]
MVLDKYEVFVRVAETQNLTKVASELNYTQSAISHVIQNLEKELGLPLVTRSKSGIRLTSYGEHLLEEARQIVQHENAFQQQAGLLRGTEVGTIRVGAFSSVSMQWMPYILEKMQKQHPNVTVIQSHDNYQGVETLLTNGQVDCGFLSSLYKGKFDFLPLVQDEYYVLLPPDHPLCCYERIPLEALANENFILMDEGGGIEYDTGHILKNIPFRVSHWVNEDFLAIPLVERGLGLSILPKLIMDCVDSSVVVKRFAVPRYRTIGLAAASFKEAPPLVSLFTKMVQDFISTSQLSPLPEAGQASFSFCSTSPRE